MQGVIPSRRHGLFFDRRQREGRGHSTLDKLANTSILGEDYRLDKTVMGKLEEIFRQHVGQVSSGSSELHTALLVLVVAGIPTTHSQTLIY